MNTVIPMANDRIASHFTKADSFIFIDSAGQQTSEYPNPAFNNHECSAKKKIFELFNAEKVARVIVRNIGQQSLGKLLANKMSVYKCSVNYLDSKVILDNSHSYITQLTEADQGRPSLNHEEKKAGGCCDSDSASHKEVGKKCCETSNGHNHKHGKRQGKGKGRCCH